MNLGLRTGKFIPNKKIDGNRLLNYTIFIKYTILKGVYL